MKKGYFIVIDGLDGIGKGTIERAILDYESKNGRTIFDSVKYSLKLGHIPELNQSVTALGMGMLPDLILTAEPTRAGIGAVIREEMVANSGRNYSFESRIQAYSLDRLVQMKKLVVPAIQAGIPVLQSRCLAATLCYQSLQAYNEGKDPEEVRRDILAQEGNQFQLANRPDLLIIPTINDIDELTRRIKSRKAEGKDDDCVFENPKFQKSLKPLFESDWLVEIFKSRGTQVVYFDAGISVEESKRQAIEIYSSFLSSQ